MPDESLSPNENAPKPKRRLRGALMVAGLLAAGGVIGAGVVHAQMGGWRGDGHGWRHGDGGGMHGPRQARFARFCASDTARFQPVVRAYVKADLRLNDAQSKDFDALADQILPALEGVKSEACTNMAQLSEKAPEKLAQLAAVLRKAADAADKAVDPARKFYATLDTTQQARVDELANRRGMRRWQ